MLGAGSGHVKLCKMLSLHLKECIHRTGTRQSPPPPKKGVRNNDLGGSGKSVNHPFRGRTAQSEHERDLFP